LKASDRFVESVTCSTFPRLKRSNTSSVAGNLISAKFAEIAVAVRTLGILLSTEIVGCAGRANPEPPCAIERESGSVPAPDLESIQLLSALSDGGRAPEQAQGQGGDTTGDNPAHVPLPRCKRHFRHPGTGRKGIENDPQAGIAAT
jgi:hypothetical protein